MTIQTEKIAVIPIPSFLIPNVPVGSAECRGAARPYHSTSLLGSQRLAIGFNSLGLAGAIDITGEESYIKLG